MTDYNKLTVANLRGLLKERGIPSTGLTRKQQIIERLEEEDNAAPTTGAQPEADDDAPPDEAEDEEMKESIAPDEPTAQEDDLIEKVSAEHEPDREPERAVEHHDAIQPTEASTKEPDAVAEVSPAPPVEERTQRPGTANTSVSQTPIPTHEQPLSAPVEAEAETASTTADPELSAETSRLGSADIIEDSRKRKRRSVTPPLDAQEAAKKKLKQEEESGTVHLKEDGGVPVEKGLADATEGGAKCNNEVLAEADAPVDAAPAETVLPAKTSDDVMDISHTRMAEEKAEPSAEQREDPSIGERGQQVLAERVDFEEDQRDRRSRSPEGSRRPSSPRHSAKPVKEVRYKSLFQPASGPGSAETPSHVADAAEDDRPISPALHPATRGLYIRNFMRPLQPAGLKSHLIALASPPSSASPNPDVLELFHLDPIRTHVLALFNSVSAAARVRSNLHDAVWPAERSRKALWADFVPEEKVQEWIDTEEAATKEGGSRMGKRWEVIYEPVTPTNDDGDADAPTESKTSVRAVLREAGAPSATPTQPNFPSARTNSLSGPSTAPAPPAPSTSSKDGSGAAPSAPAASPAAKPFVALDKLFSSTTAKPKLYFLPVPQALADKRLDELDRCTKRDWRATDDDAKPRRRYTFQDGEVLVDAGPEEGAVAEPRVRGRGAERFYRGGGRGGGAAAEGRLGGYRDGGGYGEGGGFGGGRGGFKDRGWGDTRAYEFGSGPSRGGGSARWR
ncbi:uncharacterized protein K452DRAFT_357090 [Aplosporella prunicola CBS 121167]|uniref:SAP domain-containing protein n=1 Tax=Aplosporella prunicola CBS 121167 TaxID=1176127 RepID=A0A6A6BNP5_9PEZI|nr:uncharacterized protein K452DRAFT_357090 [Aplosporella prunicola CBS 121167]KAF2144181.1 hypothetical protein K452DRAFT_357090 [Aplosporella prunicola CBS 121167]